MDSKSIHPSPNNHSPNDRSVSSSQPSNLQEIPNNVIKDLFDELLSLSDDSPFTTLSCQSIALLLYRTNSLASFASFDEFGRLIRLLIGEPMDEHISNDAPTDPSISSKPTSNHLHYMLTHVVHEQELLNNIHNLPLNLKQRWVEEVGKILRRDKNIVDTISDISAKNKNNVTIGTWTWFFLRSLLIPMNTRKIITRLMQQDINPTMHVLVDHRVMAKGSRQQNKILDIVAGISWTALVVALILSLLQANSFYDVLSDFSFPFIAHFFMTLIVMGLLRARWGYAGQKHFCEVKEEIFKLWLTPHGSTYNNGAPLSSLDALIHISSRTGTVDESLIRFITSIDPQNPSEDIFHQFQKTAGSLDPTGDGSSSRRFSAVSTKLSVKACTLDKDNKGNKALTTAFLSLSVLSTIVCCASHIIIKATNGNLLTVFDFVSLLSTSTAFLIIIVTSPARIANLTSQHRHRLNSLNLLVLSRTLCEGIGYNVNVNFHSEDNIASWWKLRSIIHNYFEGHIMNLNAVGVIVVMSILSSASCLILVTFVDEPDQELLLRLSSLAVCSLAMTIIPIYDVSTINFVNHRDQIAMLTESRLRIQQQSLKGGGIANSDKMAMQLQTLANIIESSHHKKHKLLGIIVNPQLITKFLMAVLSGIGSVGFKVMVSSGAES